MQITARVDYSVRALAELAAQHDLTWTGPQIAEAQDIPVKFLESIMRDLKRAGMVVAHRGRFGGYSLARSAEQITIADIVRAVDGPLAAVRGMPPEDAKYQGVVEPLTSVWVAVRASMRNVLERVTIADVIRGRLPDEVTGLLSNDAWKRRD
ncbi:RrF2 family transcriptional regulator [Rarobacter faecitabidus]|uniref:BadM/Rrf2 family transcriptional regulator n=1 Tax=Rarobacter faecitabidus TaxID=13243 RepID=A0A542ZUY3_RARFA|nr:Rrf2 family transcriptional regulator [Rarobacter faecitabidus]TQL64066.1 BadM/Rrf2 family transcriptional regulator [Rarobacter faecitabidus]